MINIFDTILNLDPMIISGSIGLAFAGLNIGYSITRTIITNSNPMINTPLDNISSTTTAPTDIKVALDQVETMISEYKALLKVIMTEGDQYRNISMETIQYLESELSNLKNLNSTNEVKLGIARDLIDTLKAEINSFNNENIDTGFDSTSDIDSDYTGDTLTPSTEGLYNQIQTLRDTVSELNIKNSNLLHTNQGLELKCKLLSETSITNQTLIAKLENNLELVTNANTVLKSQIRELIEAKVKLMEALHNTTPDVVANTNNINYNPIVIDYLTNPFYFISGVALTLFLYTVYKLWK